MLARDRASVVQKVWAVAADFVGFLVFSDDDAVVGVCVVVFVGCRFDEEVYEVFACCWLCGDADFVGSRCSDVLLVFVVEFQCAFVA